MTFKVEVGDYGDDELNRMAAAFEALRRLPPSRQPEAVEWVRGRLRKERLARMDLVAVVQICAKRGFRYRQRKRRLPVALATPEQDQH